MIDYSANDIGLELATSAYRGTSMTPERRGQARLAEYTSHLANVVEEFEGYATDINRDEIAEALERYRDGYVRRYRAYLAANSRTASTLVTGPANFPTARNRQRIEAADKRLEELLEYSEKVLTKLRKRYDPEEIARQPIRSTDADAIERLEEKIAEAEDRHERMKAVNRIVRSKKSDVDKVLLLNELGYSDKIAEKLITNRYLGQLGYPSFEIQNNYANIKRMKERIESIRNLQSGEELDMEVGEIKAYEYMGRVCIDFPGKPDKEVRDMLKAHGFRWSPSVRAWTRQATHVGRDVARTVIGKLAETATA